MNDCILSLKYDAPQSYVCILSNLIDQHSFIEYPHYVGSYDVLETVVEEHWPLLNDY